MIIFNIDIIGIAIVMFSQNHYNINIYNTLPLKIMNSKNDIESNVLVTIIGLIPDGPDKI